MVLNKLLITGSNTLQKVCYNQISSSQ